MYSNHKPFRLMFFVSLVAALFSFQSCSPSKTAKTSIEITLSSEGPYFSGPNSFTNEYSVDLSSLLAEETLNSENIRSIKLMRASLKPSADSEINFSQFNSASLQVVSDDVPMTSIAILNPLPDNASSFISLNTSEEADLTEFFKQPNFTYLLDLDFKEDNYDDAMSIVMALEFSIEYN